MMYITTVYRTINDQEFEIKAYAEILRPETDVGIYTHQVGELKLEHEEMLMRELLKTNNVTFERAWYELEDSIAEEVLADFLERLTE